jgi:tRNA G10  N-methylase Trm11
MKESGRNARFINKEGNPNTAIIVKSGLMKHGMDYNLTLIDDHFAISQTVAIQNANFYELRDYGKPLRLRREGMLPPKLAQIMINLSGIVQRGIDLTNTTLYDPFCGSGTILGEALLKGMNVIGSDIERTAIEAAGMNLKNLQQEGLGREEASTRVFLQDATALTPHDLPQPPNLVVSESYLGPAQSHFPTEQEILDLYPKLVPIYRNFFKALHPCLKPHTPVVIALPVYHTNKKAVRLPNLVDKLIPIQYKLRRTLLYHRPNQVVGREILVLETL